MGKRRFAVTGSGGTLKTDASRYDSTSVESHTRGWNLGIHVKGEPLRPDGKVDPNYDHFTVSVTGGSFADHPRRIVLDVWEDSEGIHVEPSYCPSVIDHSQLSK